MDEKQRRRISRRDDETQWEIRHGTPSGQPIFPVRALLSGDEEGRRLHILVGNAGEAEELEQFADRSLRMLRATFPENEHQLVFWGEADETGLHLLAEEASRAVVPGQRVPYEVCRLNLDLS
jgi:hypothetical protein